MTTVPRASYVISGGVGLLMGSGTFINDGVGLQIGSGLTPTNQ